MEDVKTIAEIKPSPVEIRNCGYIRNLDCYYVVDNLQFGTEETSKFKTVEEIQNFDYVLVTYPKTSPKMDCYIAAEREFKMKRIFSIKAQVYVSSIKIPDCVCYLSPLSTSVKLQLLASSFKLSTFSQK